MSPIFRKLKKLLGDRDGDQQPEQPATVPALDPRARRKSITEQVAEIRTKGGKGFTPSWQREDENPLVSLPGPLPASNVHHREEIIDVTFEMDPNHLTLHLRDEQRTCKIAVSCICGIKLHDNELRIDLHLPVPMLIDGELRAIRSLFATIYDEAAAARWTWLGSRHARSLADCPYCFKSALEIEPVVPGAVHPMEDGKPLTTASCRACLRQFRYDYDEGVYHVTHSPEEE